MAARPMFPPVDPTFRIGNCAGLPRPQRSRYPTLPWPAKTSIFTRILAHAGDVFDIAKKIILTASVNATLVVGAAAEEHLHIRWRLDQCATIGPATARL
jgi:hypothetical protein